MTDKYNSWTKEELIKEVSELRRRRKFGLVWEDKEEEALQICNENIPVLEEVKELEIIKNKNLEPDLIIEGDNFHSLLILNSTHKGKIDGIYIDPPYNTGNNDWKYNNKFVDLEDPYRHTKWISFMHKRLRLSRELLKNEGIICVTIDDYELPRLWLLMEEIFGEQNHLGTVCIRNNPAGRSTQKGISINHEYALFFSKTDQAQVGRLPRSAKQFARYKKEDSSGRYEEVNFRKPGGIRSESPQMFYPIFISSKGWRIPKMSWNQDSKEWNLEEKPHKNEEIIFPIDDKGREKRWRWSLERTNDEKEEIFVKKVKGKLHLFYKGRMTHETVLPNTWWDKNEYSAQDHGTKKLKEIFGDLKSFDYPKAELAVEDCLRVLSNKKDAVFLDFFAGSGTTGHAVKNLNLADSGSRKFILCTNNENNIAREDCYERMKRVINGYENQQTNEKVKGLQGNLIYLKTDFAKNPKSDGDKKILFDKAFSVISVKEMAYELIKEVEGYKILKGQEKFIAILSDLLFLDKLKGYIASNKENFKIYIFSLCDDEFSEEFNGLNNVLEVISYPEPIIENMNMLVKQ